MYCEHCGNQIPDNASVCEHCGKPVYNPRRTSSGKNSSTYSSQTGSDYRGWNSAGQNQNSNSQNPNRKNAGFRTSALNYEGNRNSGYNRQPKKSFSRTFAALICVFALCLVGTGIGVNWFYSFDLKTSAVVTGKQGNDMDALIKGRYDFEPAEYQFISYSDFYDDYAYVSYFKERNNPDSYTVSLINKEGKICPLNYQGDEFDGFKVGTDHKVYVGPVKGGGTLVQIRRLNTQDRTVYLIDHQRNVTLLNNLSNSNHLLSATTDRFLTATAEDEHIRRLKLIDAEGNLLNSYEPETEMEISHCNHDPLEGGYFGVEVYSKGKGENSRVSRNVILMNDTKTIVYEQGKTYPDAPTGVKMIAALDNTYKDETGENVLTFFASDDQIYKVTFKDKRLTPETWTFNQHRLFMKDAYNDDTGYRCAVLTIDGEKAAIDLLEPKTSDGESLKVTYYTEQAWLDDGVILDQIATEKNRDDYHHFAIYSNNDQNVVLCPGTLTENCSMKQLVFMGQNMISSPGSTDFGSVLEDAPYICSLDGNDVVLYDREGKEALRSADYYYAYQFSDGVVRMVPDSLAFDWDESSDLSASVESESPDDEDFDKYYRNSDIVYLDAALKPLFDQITEPDLSSVGE